MEKANLVIENPLPANLDAERAILGVMLIDEFCAVETIPLVRAEDFFLESHRRIFSAIEQLTSSGKTADLVTVVDLLEKTGQLEACSGPAYVSALLDGAAKTKNTAYYAEIVREKARLRNIVYAANAIQQRALDEDQSSEVLDGGVSALLKIASDDGGESLPRIWAEVTEKAYQEVDFAARNPNLARRFRSGFGDLDEFTGSLRPQELAIIVGQSSHGKTALAEQYANDSESRGYKVLVFSAEMRAESLALRQMARDAGIKFYWVRRPETMIEQYGEGTLDRLKVEAGRSRNIWIVDKKITPASIRAAAEAQKRLYGLDLLIVDYDQLVIRATRWGQKFDEYAAQAQFVGEALDLAKRLDVCFLLLCQPRKVDIEVARGERGPRLEDVFGSSAVTNTAHNVLWVIREFFQRDMNPAYERKGMIWILKARNDKTGFVRAEFNPDRMIWTDPPPSEADSTPESSTSKRRGGRGRTTSTAKRELVPPEITTSEPGGEEF